MASSVDISGKLLAQAVSSSSSGDSISARQVTFFPSIFSISLLLASNLVALVALSDEIPDLLRLILDDGRLISVAMSLAIAACRTDDDCCDGGQPEARVKQHHNPRSHNERSNARRFTSPGSTRPPPYTHCGLPLSDSFIARHAPFQSPELNRFAVVLWQYAPVPTL